MLYVEAAIRPVQSALKISRWGSSYGVFPAIINTMRNAWMAGCLIYQDPVLCGTFGMDASNGSSGNSISSNLLGLAVWTCAILEVLKRLIRSKTSLFNLHRPLSHSIHIRDGISLEYNDYSSKAFMIS